MKNPYSMFDEQKDQASAWQEGYEEGLDDGYDKAQAENMKNVCYAEDCLEALKEHLNYLELRYHGTDDDRLLEGFREAMEIVKGVVKV